MVIELINRWCCCLQVGNICKLLLGYHGKDCSTNKRAGLFCLYIQYRIYVRRPVHLNPTSKELPWKKLSVFDSCKNFFEDFHTQERLSALACVSIKKGILKKLQNQPTWHDKLIARFAKEKDQVILLYK